MSDSRSSRGGLQEIGYIRQAQLIGTPSVTAEQAQANRRVGKGPRRPRCEVPAILPWSAATLWRKVKRGEFPAPIKLSEGVTAWNADAVREWLDAREKQSRQARLAAPELCGPGNTSTPQLLAATIRRN